ncbi:MAG: hypothetical protein ACLFWM_00025 [Actinomycetota bacterium]
MQTAQRNRVTHGEAGLRPAISVAAGLSAVTAFLYLLIGARAVTVLDTPEDQTAFGLIAAAAFLAGSAVLLVVRRRWVWILGTLGVVFVIFTYFNLAPERSPQFELWGILIRVLQAGLLVTLAYLAARPLSPGNRTPR